MKNILYILLCAAVVSFAFSGCAQKKTDIQADYLRMLEEPATEQGVSDVGAFLEKNLKKFDENNADQMVVAYEDYVYSLYGDTMDYEGLLDKYGKYISGPLTDLYSIKIEEQEAPPAIDSVLVKSWRELCERAHSLEIFIKENKNYQLVRDEATDIYKLYIKLMLMGTTVTPVFSPDGAFDEEAQNAYIDFTAAYPDTVAADIINEYFAYLNSIDFNLDYKAPTSMTVFTDTCAYLVAEAGKRVLQ